MLRYVFSIIVILGLMDACPVVFANDDTARSSAFQFASNRDWSNALAHARRASDPVLVKLITWEYVLDADSGASFDEITRFIADNPSWPEQKKLHLRAEMALKDPSVPDQKIMEWFGDATPISGVGKIALAEALMRKSGQTEQTKSLIRDAWRGGDFDEPQEQKILDKYGSVLRREDSIARIDRLLWEERIGAAKRVMSRTPSDYQRLFKARIALQDNKRLAVIAVAEVPSALKNDAGLIYDRMMYRSRRDDDSGVRDMLLAAPSQVPYPEKWWRHREFQIRKAIDEKKYPLAKKLLANHSQIEGASLADANWLNGWLKTEFMGNPKSGFTDFETMFEDVHYPVSKARAAYWAGRAAEKSGDAKKAQTWYHAAGAYPTTFYGQLGIVKSGAGATLNIPDAPSISSEARQKFEHNELAQAIKLCIQMKEFDFAAHLLSMVIENSDDEAEIAMLSELGAKAGTLHLSVHAAKKALQQDVVLIEAGYPTPKTPENAPIERALTLAITRQESEFDPHAHSPSNAVGMMQLLPSTAKEVAKKHGMPFSPGSMTDPLYNMTLGSLYLSRLINSYDGSYILAIAAYNAGPGNVHHWVQNFGTPNNNADQAVNWIEKIPYRETRNYVQRVLENLQVFRHIDADGDSPKLKLGEDLVR